MNSPLRKKHHYIAESIQKRFVNHDEKLWYFHPQDERGVSEVIPKAIFFTKHENSMIDENGNKDDSAEKGYDKLDSDWIIHTGEIIKAMDENICPNFNEVSSEALFYLLDFQRRRSPDLFTERDVTNAAETTLKNLPYSGESFKEHYNTHKKSLDHNTKLNARIGEPSKNMMKFFNTSQLVFIKLCDCIEGFILGSNIIAIVGDKKVWPISPRHAIAMRSDTKKAPRLWNITKHEAGFIEEANQYMASNSGDGIAGPNQGQIKRCC